jgi:hypothetical protein
VFGLEQTRVDNVGNNIIEEWKTTERWALFKIMEDGGTFVFLGNLKVELDFPNVAQVVPGL